MSAVTTGHYRIPVVNKLKSPDQPYLICVIVGDNVWNRGLMPTDQELRLLRHFLNFQLSQFSDHDVRQMAQEPFDLAAGTDTMMFMKCAPGDWCYRQSSWPDTYHVFPAFRELRKADLPDLLMHHAFSGWTQWLSDHPVS